MYYTIFINSDWVSTRWQWSVNMYTNTKNIYIYTWGETIHRTHKTESKIFTKQENKNKADNKQERQRTYNVTLRRVWVIIVAVEKQYLLHTCLCVKARVRAFMHRGLWACSCLCVSTALLIHHTMRMHHIVTYFVAPLVPPKFSTLSHKRPDFQGKFIEHKICVSIFSTTLSKISLILRRIQPYIVINAKTSLCKVPLIIVGF
jgi:hypothetical protein